MNNVKEMPQSPAASVGRARAVLRDLIESCPNPACLLELYYWSAEVELLEVLHRFLALPEQPREALRAFLAMAADCPDSVVVNVSQNGDVTLSSPAVAQLMNEMDAAGANTDRGQVSH